MWITHAFLHILYLLCFWCIVLLFTRNSTQISANLANTNTPNRQALNRKCTDKGIAKQSSCCTTPPKCMQWNLIEIELTPWSIQLEEIHCTLFKCTEAQHTSSNHSSLCIKYEAHNRVQQLMWQQSQWKTVKRINLSHQRFVCRLQCGYSVVAKFPLLPLHTLALLLSQPAWPHHFLFAVCACVRLRPSEFGHKLLLTRVRMRREKEMPSGSLNA